MNKVFSFFSRLHGYIYLLIGIVLSFPLVINYEHRELMLTLKEWKSILVTLSCVILAINHLSMHTFYGRSQVIRKEITTGSGRSFVFRDLYFPIKINSGINAYKKAMGYVYVIFRVLSSVMIGFVLGLAIFYWLKATYA